jgi:hypothetical protein
MHRLVFVAALAAACGSTTPPVQCAANWCQANQHLTGAFCDGTEKVSCAQSGACAVEAGRTHSADCGACTTGEVRRCWVECVQTYADGCLHADLPPHIRGLETCAKGAWGPCTTLSQCNEYGPGPCTPNETKETKWQCMDGETKTGAFLCTKPLGASCSVGYYSGWGVTDCVLTQDQLCNVTGDTCEAEGETRACTAHCDTPDGPVKNGTQTCMGADCGGGYGHVKFWGPCDTQDACKG